MYTYTDGMVKNREYKSYIFTANSIFPTSLDTMIDICSTMQKIWYIPKTGYSRYILNEIQIKQIYSCDPAQLEIQTFKEIVDLTECTRKDYKCNCFM